MTICSTDSLTSLFISITSLWAPHKRPIHLKYPQISKLQYHVIDFTDSVEDALSIVRGILINQTIQPRKLKKPKVEKREDTTATTNTIEVMDDITTAMLSLLHPPGAKSQVTIEKRLLSQFYIIFLEILQSTVCPVGYSLQITSTFCFLLFRFITTRKKRGWRYTTSLSPLFDKNRPTTTRMRNSTQPCTYVLFVCCAILFEERLHKSSFLFGKMVGRQITFFACYFCERFFFFSPASLSHSYSFCRSTGSRCA